MAAPGEVEVSLRPLALRPGNGSVANPFATFGKGLGYGIKGKSNASAATFTEREPRRTGERVKYTKEFLLKFMEKYNNCPGELEQLNMEIVVTVEDRASQQEMLQKVAEDIDDRDWRTRAPATSGGREGREREPREYRETRDYREAREPREPRETKEFAPKEPREPLDKPPRRDQEAARPAPRQDQPAAAPTQVQAQAPAPSQAVSQAASQDVAKIQRAEELGRQAYKVGGSISAEDRAVRTIKGILNKLTPEKFERLLNQMLEVITTADVLQKTIALVFENAVEQPTYCAMYADLCVSLSKELPHFPPAPGSDKPRHFRQILLNTCQDEFEGAEAAREALAGMDGPERDDAERKVKKRILGTMRLICELYKQDMVKDFIINACLSELLDARASKAAKAAPEDNIEAVCEMITLCGSKLAKSDKPDVQKKLESVVKELDRLQGPSAASIVSSRVRFMCKEVIELKNSKWIPRKEGNTVKKLDEVRAQAEAELGMISSTVLASVLPQLPAQQRYGVDQSGGFGSRGDDIPLIPPLRTGGDAELFPAFRGDATADSFSGRSALLGDYTPPPMRVQLPLAQAAPPPQAQAPEPVREPTRPAAPAAADGKALSVEEVARKVQNLLQEYTSTLDKGEAVLCIRDLGPNTDLSKVVEFGLSEVFNALTDKAQDVLTDLLLHTHEAGVIKSDHMLDALGSYTTQLEDLSMDVPKAPALLGKFFGSCVCRDILGIDTLPQLLEGEGAVGPKRRLAAEAFKSIRKAKGDAGLKQMCADAGLTAGTFLKGDPEFDSEEPALEEWLTSEGLTGLVPV